VKLEACNFGFNLSLECGGHGVAVVEQSGENGVLYSSASPVHIYFSISKQELSFRKN
jgi:hypothetical protein